MRILFALILVIVLACGSFSLTYPPLLNAPKTIGYYLMPNFSSPNISSGLVYYQRDGKNSYWEALYTSYNSFYLVTNNVTRLNLHRRMSVLELGPLNVSLLAGLGLAYSPAVGGGLFGDLGGALTVPVIDSIQLNLPLQLSLYSDGFIMTIMPGVNAKVPSLPDYELLAGLRVEAQMVGSPSSAVSSASGTFNIYYAVGLRKVI